MRPTPQPSIPGGACAPTDDTIAEVVQTLVQHLLAGRGSEAEQAVAQLQTRPQPGTGREALLAKTQLRIFQRDGFTCRYCAKRTLFVPVLRLLSRAYPDTLRFHPHWRWDATHPVYWTHGSSCDHVVPVCRGGSSAADNLATACYQCNSIKQHWLLEELRWGLMSPPSDPEWDGLSGSYLELCRTLGTGGDRYHESWMKALTPRR